MSVYVYDVHVRMQKAEAEHDLAECSHFPVITCHLESSLDFYTLFLGDLFCGGHKQPPWTTSLTVHIYSHP